jgi:hypothetical protein
MSSIHLPPGIKERFSHLALTDLSFDCPAPIDLLFRADVFNQVLDGKRVTINNFSPTAFGSLFGWIIIGPVAESPSSVHCHVIVIVMSLAVSLEEIV